MKYYLAYGSNLNKAQMAHRCPDAIPIGKCVLKNWELVFRRGVLTIEQMPGASTPVGIWAISENDEKNLDRYEGYPHLYYKTEYPLILTGYKDGKAEVKEKVASCMAYIMTGGHPVQAPSKAYLDTCLQGYRDFGIKSAPLMNAFLKAKRGGDV